MVCPKCKEKISYVHYDYSKTTTGTFDPEDEVYDDDYNIDDTEYTYRCPECDFILGTDDYDILEMFKEKEDIKKVIENVKKIGGKDGNAEMS